MKLKKLIYSIAAASMIAPLAIDSFSQSSTVQASTNGKAVSKKVAMKYSYKTIKKTIYGSEFSDKESFSKFSGASIKKKYTVVSGQPGADVLIYFHVSKAGRKIHVVTYEKYKVGGVAGNFVAAKKKDYNNDHMKRHYTFKIKKHSHNKKSHVNHNNKVTAHDIKSTNYYGKKAIGYYGFKHANGFWDMNRDLKRYVAMDHNFFPFWQAGNGAAYKVKGNYVHFNQSMLTTKEKSLIVKVSKVAKYSNSRGGKSMLKNIKTIGTAKELSKLTNE